MSKLAAQFLALLAVICISAGCSHAGGEHAPRDIQAALEQLNDDDANARVQAIAWIIAECAEGGLENSGEVLPRAISMLRDPDPLVRAAAAVSLRRIIGFSAETKPVSKISEARVLKLFDENPGLREIVEKLTDALGDEYKIVRLAAAQELMEIGPAAYSAVPELLKIISDESIDDDLKPLGRKIPREISAVIPPEDGSLLRRALSALTGIGDIPGDAAGTIIGLLSNEKPQVRVAAIKALGVIGQEPGVVDALIPMLGDIAPEARSAAADALRSHGSAASDALPELLELLDDETLIAPLSNLQVRQSAINAVAAISPDDEDTIGAMLDMLKSETSFMILTDVSNALLAMKHTPEVIHALTDALESEDPVLRSIAARTLGGMGGMAYGAIPILQQLEKNDTDRQVRDNAALAVEKLRGIYIPPVDAFKNIDFEKYANDTAGLFDELMRRFGEGNLAARQYAVSFFTTKYPVKSYPVLLEAMSDDDPLVRAAVAGALGKVSGGHPEAKRLLVEALDDQNRDVRLSAAAGLAHLGDGAADMVPKLIGMLSDKDAMIRAKTASALGGFGGSASEDIITALVAMFADTDDYARESAAISLGRIGGIAMPYLISALDNPAFDYKFNALRAIDLAVRIEAASEAFPDVDPASVEDDILSFVYSNDTPVIPLGDTAFIGTAIPAIIASLGDKRPEIRLVAKEITIRVAPGMLAPRLIELLRDNYARIDAVRTLREIEPFPQDAAPAIIQVLEESNIANTPLTDAGVEFVTECIFTLVTHADVEDISGILASALESPVTELRNFGAFIVGEAGAQAAPAVPLLAALLNDESPDVRYNAALALGKIGPVALQAIPALHEVSADDVNAQVRDAALDAITKIMIPSDLLEE